MLTQRRLGHFLAEPAPSTGSRFLIGACMSVPALFILKDAPLVALLGVVGVVLGFAALTHGKPTARLRAERSAFVGALRGRSDTRSRA